MADLGKMTTQNCKPAIYLTMGIVLLVVVGLVYQRTSSSPPESVTVDTIDEPTELPKIGASTPEGSSNEAYVALHYGSFFLGIRVLGQSLRAVGTTRDMVALCMDDVPDYQREILISDGWIIKSVDPLPKWCIGNKDESHINGMHYVKLLAWLLTEYRRIVLIDSDAITLHNIDALFSCGKFCAAYRHSDLFNSGVVVLKPSVEVFKSMCHNIRSTKSYTHGDQGFLNYFYKELKNATMFSPSESDVKKELPFQRLPAEYNGDAGVYYLLNKWMYLDVEEPYVLHYTLGPVKPWKWWSYPLFSLNWRWKILRDQLSPSHVNEPSLLSWMSWLPLAVLLAVGLSSNLWYRQYTSIISNATVMRGATLLVSPVSGCITKISPPLMLVFAFYWAPSFVPLTMNPSEAWTRYGLWILLFFSLPFSAYCHLAYVMGTHSGSEDTSTTKHLLSLPRLVGEALLWLVVSVFIFYMQFSISSTLTTLFERAGLFFGLAVANIVLCYYYGQRLIGLCYSLGRS